MRAVHMLLAVVIALGSAPAELRAMEIFAERGGSSDFSIFSGWRRVMTETSDALAASRATADQPCEAGEDCRLKEWRAFLKDTARLPRGEQIEAVNTWVNTRPYVEDWVNWGLPDYWATPEEFFRRGGDCEDYAIVKYFSLIQLGFTPHDLRIVVVNDLNLEVFHAVLAVRQEGSSVLLLDNQIEQPVPAALASHYRPIYELNELAWWMAPAGPMAQGPLSPNPTPVAKNLFAAAGPAAERASAENGANTPLAD